MALDTVAWIYEVEAHSVFGPIVRPFFRDRLDAGKNQAGSSILTLGELLVQPLAAGRPDIADRYRAFFQPGSRFAVWEVTRGVVEHAAQLWAKYRLTMIDALHLATAVANGASLFLSNDRNLRQVIEIKVLVLADYLGRIGREKSGPDA